jgi:hypothetical protein
MKAIPPVFTRSLVALEIYTVLIAALRLRWKFTTEEKKTSLSLLVGEHAFLELDPRKEGLRVSVMLPKALESPRIMNVEQVTRTVFRNELDLETTDQLDEELMGWIDEAHSRAK